MTPPPDPDHSGFPVARHAIAQIGVHATGGVDGCPEGIHLHLSPILLDDDGHVDFGVLGVFADVVSSQAVPARPFVHADISVNRIAAPTGTVLTSTVTPLRAGRRSSIVHVAMCDEHGTVVADSTQEIVVVAPPTAGGEAHTEHPVDDETRRSAFYAALDGVCRLPGRLHDVIGIERTGPASDPAWTLPSTVLSRNGFGGLHGGVAFDLVTEAAVARAIDEIGGPVIPRGALLRYLAPAVGGPWRAVPTVFAQPDGSAFVRVAVHDDGQDGKLCIVAEVHTGRSWSGDDREQALPVLTVR